MLVEENEMISKTYKKNIKGAWIGNWKKYILIQKESDLIFRDISFQTLFNNEEEISMNDGEKMLKKEKKIFNL